MPDLPEPVLVSVIVPTHNRAPVLGRALHSVLGQTGVPLEVIVVDDASTDDTPQVLQAFSTPPLRCLRLPARQGAAAARNAGIRLSRGAWLAFLDSDDEWLPGYLQAQLAAAASRGERLGVSYTRVERLDGRQRQLVPGCIRTWLNRLPLRRYRLSGNLTEALARGNFITLQSALVRRTCLDQAGMFDERLPRLQDWDLWLRLATRCQFAYLPRTLVRLHASPGSLSASAQGLQEAVQIIQEKHAAGSPALAAHCQFILGSLHLYAGRTAAGREALRKAVRGAPLTLAYWLAWLAAALHPALYRLAARRLGCGYRME
jgi:glycosyltransferase involved in cell wall biosynthesis